MQPIPGGALAAIYGNRVESFRYELHRYAGGIWSVVDDDLQGVRECVITHDRRARIKRSATFRIEDDLNAIKFTSDVVRVYWKLRAATVGATTYEFNMGTFYMNTPEVPLTNAGRVRDVVAYDALQLTDARKLRDWLTIPADDNVIGTVINLLTQAFPGAGILMPTSPDLIGANEENPSPKMFAIGTPLLDVVNRLLAYVNYYSLRCDPNGSFQSEPYMLPAYRFTEFTFSDTNPMFIGDASVLRFDVFDAPTNFVLSCGRPGEPAPYPLISEYEVSSGPFSSAQRAGVISVRHESVDVISQAKLDEMVLVFAAETLMDRHSIAVKTPLLPSDWADCVVIGPYDRLPASEPQGAKYIERSWTFPCVPGGVMEHVYQPVYETT